MNSRIDMITTTNDLNKSIDLYQKIIGFEMRPLSNPVLIFKYDFTSFYVYQDSFFNEQFGFNATQLSGNGMLSVEIESKIHLEELRERLDPYASDLFHYLPISNIWIDSLVIKDFNGLTIQFWVNSQNA